MQVHITKWFGNERFFQRSWSLCNLNKR